MKREGFAKVLRIRDFTLLTAMAASSQLGDRLTHMVLITMIGMMAPGRVFAFGEASVAFTLPILIFSPIAGVVVDRLNPQQIMVSANFLQAGLLAAAPFLISWIGGMYPIWVVIFLFFTLCLFINTSRLSVIPDIVARRKLLLANSVMSLVARIATVIGMVLGGFLVGWLGWRLSFLIDAATHGASGGFAAGIRLPPWSRAHKAAQPLSRALTGSFKEFYQELKEVGLVVFRDRVVGFVMASIWVMTLVAGVAYTILVWLIQQELGMGTPGVGVMAGVLGLGMLLGALLLGMVGTRHRSGLIIFGFAVIGICFLAGPFLVNPWFLYPVALVSGALFSGITIAQDTMLHEEVGGKIRGRIFATKEFMSSASFLLSALLVGGLADHFSYKAVLWSVGVLLILLCWGGFCLMRPKPSK